MTAAESGIPAVPEARTASGTVRGRHEDGLAVFRGVPYAQPPVGDARFAPPRPVRPWDGVREAYAFGPPAPQGTTPMPGPPETLNGDDWLTVNIWTPQADPAARRPVMVWIHGGAYVVGWSGSSDFDGSRLARDGELVVVTLNYRLGMEGFAHIEGAPDNRGLLDQVAALEWVRENIAAFGGDPGNVTVFGESSGAGSVAALLAMPRAAGLFRRAVAQSAPGPYLSPELARDVGTALAAGLGLPATVEGLSAVEPRRLTGAGDGLTMKMLQHEDRWGAYAHTAMPFAPVVDGDVLPETPWTALARGAARDVELLAGHNRDECRLFFVPTGILAGIDDEKAAAALRAFAPGPDGERAYRQAYPAAGPDLLFERVWSDWLFRMPSLHLAEAHAAGGGRAYLYELTWPAPAQGGALGACHGLDVPLVFGTFASDTGRLLLGPEPSPEAEELSARFRTSWAAFAATGDPGWPAYDAEQRLTRVLDARPTVTGYPEEASRGIWQGHPFAALPLLGG
ncbi:carboxylesterase/lipase family protein [Streptomyces gamaensis]|uniref:Carboxylic ester hydrolase n=1 Tax=Streptomyces gamaensis TaxID=1763542 RepID=A0ABW0Z348_9ACTN